MIEIDERDHQQGSRKGEKGEKAYGKPEFPEKGTGQATGQSFDQWIAPGELLSAVPALAPEKNIPE